MKALISPPKEKALFDPKLGAVSWRWDENAVTISIERAGIVGLSANDGQESAARLSQQLNNNQAFIISNEAYMRCALMVAANTTKIDPRFASDFSLKGLDIRIQYTGEMLRLRPHGGKFNNQWISIPSANCGWEGNPI